MKPILHEADKTSYQNNGFGILNDCISCVVTHEINGVYDLEMEYPSEGIHADEIRERRIITARPDPYSEPQPFRITRIRKSKTSHRMTAWAQHIAFDTDGIPVGSFTGTNARNSITAMRQEILNDVDFDVSTSISSSATMRQNKPKSLLRSIIGSENSFVDTYGGELEFNGNAIRILPRLGYDNGVTIRYGRNLTDMEQEIDTEKLYSGVAPFWHDDETGLTIQPIGYIVPIPGVSGLERVLTLDLSDKFDSRPTPDQVKAAAEKYITENGVGQISASLDVDFYQLDQENDGAWMREVERCGIGDTVTVIFGGGLSSMSRVNKTVFDVLNHRYKKVSIGTIKKNLADELARLMEGK